jgi:pimeloyl-ACP methyl ester carboxylesterase
MTPPTGTTMRTLVGTEVRCSVQGPLDDDGAARPLLLLSGLGAPLETWAPLRTALGDRTTIAVDAPGTGGSPTPWWPTSVPGLARLAVALLDDLGVQHADVLGYSFGGTVAQELARRAPDRVGALVLAATNCGWGGLPGDPMALGSLLSPFPVRMLPPGRGSLRGLTGDPGPRGAFSVADAAWAARPPNPLGAWWQLVAIGGWSSAPWLGRLRAPTLVLAGAEDRVVPPANAAQLARRIPGARLALVPGAGHFFLLADDPAAGAAVVADFLREQDPPRSVVQRAADVST